MELYKAYSKESGRPGYVQGKFNLHDENVRGQVLDDLCAIVRNRFDLTHVPKDKLQDTILHDLKQLTSILVAGTTKVRKRRRDLSQKEKENLCKKNKCIVAEQNFDRAHANLKKFVAKSNALLATSKKLKTEATKPGASELHSIIQEAIDTRICISQQE